MANTAPSTPENTPRRLAMNRSFTVPSKLAAASRTAPTAEIGAAEGIETLYVHPSASIIKFTTSGPGSRPSSSAGSPRSSSQQTSVALPWASPLERTLAAGPLEIYRVPGSVSFLHSGALLHAILPRSQCWCVDGVSKFALRVLQDTYYRIELPGETPEDLERVEELKVTLQKVLFYERTPCPFARRFSVELPEERKEKVHRRKSHGPAKRWTLDREYSWKPERGEEANRRESESSVGSGSAQSSEDEARVGAQRELAENRLAGTPQLADEAREQLDMSTPPRPKALTAVRSITAPPQLTTRSTPPSRIRTHLAADGAVDVSEPTSISSTRLNPARLRTFQAIPTDMPPSPPDSSAGIELVETPLRMQELNLEAVQLPVEDHNVEMARVDNSVHHESLSEAESVEHDISEDLSNDDAHSSRELNAHAQPPHAKDDHQNTTPTKPAAPEDPFAAIQARILARRSIGGTTSYHARKTSPTQESTSTSSSSSSSSSSTATLASRRSESAHRQKQAFTTALVQKAASVFLGPPAHLVAIMLRIAARFANGAFGSSFVVASPAGSKHVPGSFNLESIDADELEGEGEEEEEEWEEEDDFGVPLRSPIRLAALSGSNGDGIGGARARRGWDVE
ncbi:hypothetical protein LTR65_007718 [Meristemomyces frigidus]